MGRGPTLEYEELSLVWVLTRPTATHPGHNSPCSLPTATSLARTSKDGARAQGFGERASGVFDVLFSLPPRGLTRRGSDVGARHLCLASL